MKNCFIYKKWSLIILLNNLVISGFSTYRKKLLFLHFDSNNFFFWLYAKKIQIKISKVLSLKEKFIFK